MKILVQGKVQCVRSDLPTRDTGVSAGTDTKYDTDECKGTIEGPAVSTAFNVFH